MNAPSAKSHIVASLQSHRHRTSPIGPLLLPTLLLLAVGLPGFWYDPESYRALLGGKVGGDFANIWTAARLVLAGDISPLHDIAAYRTEQVALFGPDYPPHNWSYPPHLLLFVWPLGALSYEPALAVWLGVTLALYLAAARPWLGAAPGWGLFVLALAPASIINMAVGQTGFLTAALLLAGLWWLERRPILAGLAFALLTVKPQLGLLIPLVVLAGGHWRVFVSAALGGMALVGASVLVFGWQAWSDYLTIGAEQQIWILTQGEGIFTLMMPTPFMAGRLLGLGTDLAFGLQAAVSLALASVAFVLVRRGSDAKRIAMFVMLGAVMASPYAFNYDMTLVSLAALLVLSDTAGPGAAPSARLLWLTLWMLPVFVFFLNNTGLPLAPVLLGIGLWCLWQYPDGAVTTAEGPGSTMPPKLSEKPLPMRRE